MRIQNLFTRSLATARRDTRGAAIIEFALAVPILMMMVFGIIDFSRAYYTLNQLTSSVREGARAASVDPNPVANAAAIRAIVKRYAAAAGSVALTDAQITVTQANGDVTVKVVDYPFKLITPLAGSIGIGTINMSQQATFRYEWD
jgi:Flp pilus assembly protein TadG